MLYFIYWQGKSLLFTNGAELITNMHKLKVKRFNIVLRSHRKHTRHKKSAGQGFFSTFINKSTTQSNLIKFRFLKETF
jgi:hypothetical protein